MASSAGTLRRLAGLAEAGLGDRALRAAAVEALAPALPAAAHVFVATDPATGVGAAPLARVPPGVELPALIRLRYLAAGLRWSAFGRDAVRTLARDGADADAPLRAHLGAHGIVDLLTCVFRDVHGCWAWLDLWRAGGVFDDAELELAASAARILTPALRRSLLPTLVPRARAPGPGPDGPAALLLDDGLAVVGQTAPTEARLRALLPTPAQRAPIPAAAYNVAAQLVAREHGVDDAPASARVALGDGVWLVLRAGRIDGRAGGAATIAVTIETALPAERADLLRRIAGLTPREADVLDGVAGGASTRELAARLVLAEDTVQDHLKSVFAKTGVRSRRELTRLVRG